MVSLRSSDFMTDRLLLMLFKMAAYPGSLMLTTEELNNLCWEVSLACETSEQDEDGREVP